MRHYFRAIMKTTSLCVPAILSALSSATIAAPPGSSGGNGQATSGTGNVFTNPSNAPSGLVTIDTGTLVLTGAATANGAPTPFLVNAPGTLVADGSAGNVYLHGGTLHGSGIVGQIESLSGAISPGHATTGILTAGSLLMGTGTTAHFLIDGPNAGSEYDQLRLNGSLILGNASSLLVTLNDPIPSADPYFLILNDGSDAISGYFAGMPEGSEFSQGGQPWLITYTANGDGGAVGNDLALVAVPEPSSAATMLMAATVLLQTRRRR